MKIRSWWWWVITANFGGRCFDRGELKCENLWVTSQKKKKESKQNKTKKEIKKVIKQLTLNHIKKSIKKKHDYKDIFS